MGGVFGIGLKRNVIDIYTFLCRNYEEGDRIYAFGFSRGAFTMRVLAGVVATQGVLRCQTEEDLKRYAADAYRHYRRGDKLPLLRRKDKTSVANADETVGLVDRMRDMRLELAQGVATVPRQSAIQLDTPRFPADRFHRRVGHRRRLWVAD